MRTDGKPRDVPAIVVSLIFVALGAWVLMETQAMTPLGAVFPRTVATVMIVCSLALIVVNLLRRGGRPAATAEDDGATAGSMGRRVALVAIMAAWILLMPVLGFFVSSVVAFVGILLVANYDPLPAGRMAAYGAAALAVVGVFYLLMVNLLLVPVPRGLLF